MNESQAMPAPGTYFATNNGSSDLALVSALRTNPLDEVTAFAALDIKHEIWKAESDVQKAIQVQTNLLNTNNINLHNRLCESEKAAIEAKYESRLEIKDAVVRLNEKVDSESEIVKNKINHFERSVSDKFCDLERRLDKNFCELKERELQEQICSLKGQLTSANSASQTASIVAQVIDALGGTTAKK